MDGATYLQSLNCIFNEIILYEDKLHHKKVVEVSIESFQHF